METLLLQATVYLAATVIAVPVAARLGLGSVLGYLLAGIVIGPVLGLVGTESGPLRQFAEFGVVMMLFLIGLGLEPRALWDMRKSLLGLGGAQVVVTTALVTVAVISLGQPPDTALAVGLILALSSTAIVLQTLNERKLMQTEGGRASFAVLLTQDVAVIPMLALLPLLAVAGPSAAPSLPGHGEAGFSLIAGLPAWGVTLVTLAAVVLVVLLGIFMVRPLFHFVHGARLRELYTALALLIVIGIAFLMTLVGLSPALGTFLAGVVLASSEFRHELESNIEPFKGLLLGLFFITVGAGIAVDTLFGAPLTLIGLTLGLMLLKGLVLWGLALLFRLKPRDRWLFTLGLAQAGEFGFVLAAFSLQQRVLPDWLGERLLMVIALSMLLTPLAFMLWEYLTRRFDQDGDGPAPDEIDDLQPVIIAGVGRFGQVVNRMVQSAGFRTTLIDHNLETIQLMRRFGFRGFFGDPSRPELLQAAGLSRARVLVVALDDKAAATRLVSFARRANPDLHIIARARDRVHVYQLDQAGADDIVRELFDSSLRAGRYALENMGLSDFEASELEHVFFRMDRAALRELADLWLPDVPILKNQPFIDRAAELSKELETQLLSQFADPRGPDSAKSPKSPKNPAENGSGGPGG